MTTLMWPESDAALRKHQIRLLIGEGIVVALVLTGLVLIDGRGRVENRARSNESPSQEPPQQPANPSR